MCEPTEPCTESKAGGSTFSFVQRSRCVRWFPTGYQYGKSICFQICLVSESPDKPNITYEAVRKNTIEEDFSSVLRDLAERNIKARRVVVYCQSLDMCASLYAHIRVAVYESMNFWHVCAFYLLIKTFNDADRI